MINTKSIGNIGEAKVLAEFVSYGIPVYIPFGDNEQSDLVVFLDGSLQRIQIKTIQHITDGVMTFGLTSRRYDVDYKYTSDEVDYFALHCIENNSCYLLKNDGDPLRAVNLRIEKPKNNQAKGIRMAEDYLFENVLSNI